jgi:hypothetical protein
MGFHVSRATNYLPERMIDKTLLVMISLNQEAEFTHNQERCFSPPLGFDGALFVLAKKVVS